MIRIRVTPDLPFHRILRTFPERENHVFERVLRNLPESVPCRKATAKPSQAEGDGTPLPRPVPEGRNALLPFPEGRADQSFSSARRRAAAFRLTSPKRFS